MLKPLQNETQATQALKKHNPSAQKELQYIEFIASTWILPTTRLAPIWTGLNVVRAGQLTSWKVSVVFTTVSRLSKSSSHENECCYVLLCWVLICVIINLLCIHICSISWIPMHSTPQRNEPRMNGLIVSISRSIGELLFAFANCLRGWSDYQGFANFTLFAFTGVGPTSHTWPILRGCCKNSWMDDHPVLPHEWDAGLARRKRRRTMKDPVVWAFDIAVGSWTCQNATCLGWCPTSFIRVITCHMREPCHLVLFLCHASQSIWSLTAMDILAMPSD